MFISNVYIIKTFVVVGLNYITVIKTCRIEQISAEMSEQPPQQLEIIDVTNSISSHHSGGLNQQHRTEDLVAFVYPEGGGVLAMQVRESDVRRLDPDQTVATHKYLSDVGIDFIAKHIVDTTPNRGYKPFVSSSLFDSHLRSLLSISTTNQINTTWYEDFIHEHHMILAPNHGGQHFSCVSIWNPWTKPVIFHYDPIFGYHNKDLIMPTYKAYISSSKHKEFLTDEVIPEPQFVQLRGPQQLNSFDCALYVLSFIKYSLSLDATVQSQNPYEYFNDHAWSQEDVAEMRRFYYGYMIDMSARYSATHNNDDSHLDISGDGAEGSTANSISQGGTGGNNLDNNDTDYSKDLVFDAFLIQKFGSIQSYLAKIPSEKDQQWLRKVHDGKLDLLTFWTAKRTGINCGYIGDNKQDLRIYKKFLFQTSLSWAPANSHAYDECPYDPNRYPSLYGYQSFAVVETTGKHFICGYSLYSVDVGHRFMLWVNNMTLCWNPRREYILYDTDTSAFTFVQGKY